MVDRKKAEEILTKLYALAYAQMGYELVEIRVTERTEEDEQKIS